MKVSLLQAAFEGPKEENVEKAVSLVEGAEGELVLLPELWNLTDFDHLEEQAMTEGEVVEALGEASEGRTVLAGSVAEERAGEFYNTSFLLRDGEVVERYAKMHLFFEGEERGAMEPGKEVVTAEVEGATAGLSICYDLRFPELYRAQLDEGAELLLVPSAWPLERLNHWDLLTRTRAVENQSLLVACNRAGSVGHIDRLAGSSRVVGPWGEILYGAGEGEEVVEAEVDMGRPRETRERFPVLRDRRDDL